MLQDISPHHLDIAFETGKTVFPQPQDLVAAWQGNELLLLNNPDQLALPEALQCQVAGWDMASLR